MKIDKNENFKQVENELHWLKLLNLIASYEIEFENFTAPSVAPPALTDDFIEKWDSS